ncbi:(2Fe-2S)-binding protein [Propylenella binzhouense]|uniref:(2Fe-2S)-binding protein n=1 Tax=Propylenella binzhouense TaxID=2555902 RepID=A0A964T547_9HYPH|nr:(2Fe-2S)-binding protein [Propylenella binzhouense]MYZ48585.1 (2Fe-2S)-binding protein [Propylenella binzhouense]
MSQTRSIAVTVNGRTYEKTVETRRTLVDFLRVDLGLTGTHIGCEHGACGACTVRVEGEAVRSCLMLAVQANGKSIVTVEGLAQGNALNPLQQAFWEKNGLQCGFCTPGMLMTISEFLEEVPSPTEEEVREALSGNVCRCTGYQAIVDAVLQVAAQARAEKEAV